VRIGGVLQPFACIEVSDELRYIETLSVRVLLLTDLEFRGAARLARALHKAYLADTGD
jgi:aminoglycoside phosphotransferase family enzyme